MTDAICEVVFEGLYRLRNYLASIGIELVIQRSNREASEAAIAEHYFGGGSKESRIEIREGTPRLPLRERDENGSPLEWIESNVLA